MRRSPPASPAFYLPRDPRFGQFAAQYQDEPIRRRGPDRQVRWSKSLPERILHCP